NASMTARCRSLVWFIALLTSGATNSIDALSVSVSGVPCTWPAPTTVTWRVPLSADPVGPDDESQAESPTAASPAAASTRTRADIFALAAVGMPRTIPSGSHQDLAVRVGVGQLVERRADAVQADVAGDHRCDIDVALGDRAQAIRELRRFIGQHELHV